MMIFFKERLAYLAVPKTGTSAVERALGRSASALFRDPPGLKHTNARGFERRFRKIFDRKDLPPMETVAVIREPVAWLGSWYRYRQRPALSGHENSTEGLSFDAFVEAYLQDKPPAFAQIGAQGKFVTDENSELLVNHLFQYEQQSLFLKFLENRLRRDIDLQTVNKSPTGQTQLSRDLLAELRSIRKLDFQLHNALSDGPLSIG